MEKRVLNIMKNINNLQVLKPTLMRIQLQVFLDILNNFHLIIEKYVWNENVNILFIKEKKHLHTFEINKDKTCDYMSFLDFNVKLQMLNY